MVDVVCRHAVVMLVGNSQLMHGPSLASKRAMCLIADEAQARTRTGEQPRRAMRGRVHAGITKRRLQRSG